MQEGSEVSRTGTEPNQTEPEQKPRTKRTEAQPDRTRNGTNPNENQKRIRERDRNETKLSKPTRQACVQSVASQGSQT